MSAWSAATAARIFAVFAALDLGVLLTLSSHAVRDARQVDPAGLLPVFEGMQAVAAFGLFLLALGAFAAAVRASIRSALAWRPAGSSRETFHVEA